MSAPHPFRTLISQPNFVKLWGSQLLSQLTIHLVNFLILTRVFEVTTSSIAVSLLWLAYSLPALGFAPVAGAVVDRFSRRKMMIATNLLQAGVVSLYLLVHQRLYFLYILVFAYSLLDQLYLPSQQASLPSIVEKKLLPAANGLFLLTQQASFLTGFGLGGIFLALLGRNRTIVLATVFLVLAAISVYLLPRDWARFRRVTTKLKHYWSDFSRGMAFIKSHRPVMYPLFIIAFAQTVITIMAITLPAYTKNVLGLDLGLASLILVVPGALGAIVITAILPKFGTAVRKKSIMEAGLFSAAVSMGLLAFLGSFGDLRWLLAIGIATGMGLAMASVTVPAQTLVQEHTPNWFRGRVYGSLNMLLIVATAGPLVLSAALADTFGVVKVIGAMAVIILAVLLFINRRGDYALSNGFRL